LNYVKKGHDANAKTAEKEQEVRKKPFKDDNIKLSNKYSEVPRLLSIGRQKSKDVSNHLEDRNHKINRLIFNNFSFINKKKSQVSKKGGIIHINLEHENFIKGNYIIEKNDVKQVFFVSNFEQLKNLMKEYFKCSQIQNGRMVLEVNLVPDIPVHVTPKEKGGSEQKDTEENIFTSFLNLQENKSFIG
jgi:hypothetical protein